MVARAVSPTSAATSTRLAAATMHRFYRREQERRQAATVRPAPNRSHATPRAAAPIDETRNASTRRHAMKRTPIRVEPISSYLERYRKGTARADPSGRGRGRAGLRVRPAAVRSGDRRDHARAVRAAGRAGAGSAEAVPGDRGLVADRWSSATSIAHRTRRISRCSTRSTTAISWTTRRRAIFVHVPSWPGPFDVEIDCVAVLDN